MWNRMSNKVMWADRHIHIQLGSWLLSVQTATEPPLLCHYNTHRLSLLHTCSITLLRFHRMTVNMQYLSYALTSLIMISVSVDVRSSVLPGIGHRTDTCSTNILCILMYLLCILYSLLSIQTNAQHIYTYIRMYIHIYTRGYPKFPRIWIYRANR